MSAISILAAGSHCSGVLTGAVDVSTYSTLRLDAAVTDYSQNAAIPETKHTCRSNWRLDVTIETASSASGKWLPFQEFALFVNSPTKRLNLTGFDKFVRVSALIRTPTTTVDGVPLDALLNWSLTGEAV